MEGLCKSLHVYKWTATTKAREQLCTHTLFKQRSLVNKVLNASWFWVMTVEGGWRIADFGQRTVNGLTVSPAVHSGVFLDSNTEGSNEMPIKNLQPLAWNVQWHLFATSVQHKQLQWKSWLVVVFSNVHLSIHSLRLILVRGLEPIWATLGREAGYILDRSPAWRSFSANSCQCTPPAHTGQC